MTHEELKEQLPLYATGGLDAETADAVERHLAEPCDSCAAEVQEWQEVVGLISLGVTPAGPSDVVKDRLMARIRQDLGAKVVPLRPRRWRAAWIAVPLAAAATILLAVGYQRYQAIVQFAFGQSTQIAVVTKQLAQEQEKLAAREAEMQQLAMRLSEQQTAAEEKARQVAQLEAASAQQQAELAEQRKLVSLREQELARVRDAGGHQQTQSSSYVQEISTLQADLTKQRDRVAASENELKELRLALDQQRALVEANAQEMTQLRSAVARQRGVIEVLTAPGLRVGYLRQAKSGVSTQGHVLWNDQKKAWLFYAFGMPSPPPGKEYQVWFMTELEGPVSAGVFMPDQNGTGVVVAEPPSKMFGKIVATAVTLEPAGGLPKPSGEMYLRGSL